MIHFFPELGALYHRSILVSLSSSSQKNFFDTWIKQMWRISPDQSTFHTIALKKNAVGHINGWASGSLGRRNADQQRFLSTSANLNDLFQRSQLCDLGDSLFIELNWQSTETEKLFRWTPPLTFSAKKVVWCLNKELGPIPSLHELALDKKLKEIAPNSLRILWEDGQFMRDALEWVLSF